MIFSKRLSVIISACMFLFLMLLTSIVSLNMFPGRPIPVGSMFFVIVYYFIARAFYTYLRNDDLYKNTRQHSSDKPGEKYWIKGERDNRKIFIIVWIFLILVLAAVSLIVYSYTH